jgi:hypothetical protein
VVDDVAGADDGVDVVPAVGVGVGVDTVIAVDAADVAGVAPGVDTAGTLVGYAQAGTSTWSSDPAVFPHDNIATAATHAMICRARSVQITARTSMSFPPISFSSAADCTPHWRSGPCNR